MDKDRRHQLELLDRQNDPGERRFVRINGQRRVEGDRLENNAVIEAITPEGLVLRWGGMRLAQPMDR